MNNKNLGALHRAWRIAVVAPDESAQAPRLLDDIIDTPARSIDEVQVHAAVLGDLVGVESNDDAPVPRLVRRIIHDLAELPR